LVEHEHARVFHLADRIMVMAEGSVLAEGTPEQSRRDERVQSRTSVQATHEALEARDCRRITARAYPARVGLSLADGQVVTLLGRNGAARPPRCAA